MGALEGLALRFSAPDIDRAHDQEKLDLSRRSRTSLFPWRGQFSPDLVAVLMEDLPSGLIVDPFVGSGTTLYEASRTGMEAVGAEINPAALCFAVLSELSSQPLESRTELGRRAAAALGPQTGGPVGGLFAESNMFGTQSGPAMLRSVLSELTDCPEAADLVRAALLLAMGQTSTVEVTSWAAELTRVRRLVEGLPRTSGRRRAIGADARRLPLDDGAAVAAVTSPPYINVFNYHQHYRPAVELMGAGSLSVAQAELGSNRKHRQNRFLTVVQYAMDMADALVELRRVLADGGVAKVVVGRESNVRRVPFRNGELLATLAEGSGAFTVERWQERRFTTRFGESIFEDLLTLRRNRDLRPVTGFDCRAAGAWTLERAITLDLPPDVRSDIETAVAKAEFVARSPLFVPASVPWMRREQALAVQSN